MKRDGEGVYVECEPCRTTEAAARDRSNYNTVLTCQSSGNNTTSSILRR